MRHSQKHGFINILFVMFVIPSGLKPLSLQEDSVKGQPRQLLMVGTALRGFDSFPSTADSERKHHRIVKKQMAVSDYFFRRPRERNEAKIEDDGEREKSLGKRYVLAASYKPRERSKRQIKKEEEVRRSIKRLRGLCKKRKELPNRKGGSKSEFHDNLRYTIDTPTLRFPDEDDSHCFYECEPDAEGCLKLQHRVCPEGQVFSPKYMECLNRDYMQMVRRTRRYPPSLTPYSKKVDIPYPGDIEPEPSNEWLDANPGCNYKIPPEFKPKTTPILKIYHLRCKRQLDRDKSLRKRHNINSIMATKAQRSSFQTGRAKQKFHQHHPRSFVIHIHKKERTNDQEEGIAENEENDDDDDDEDEDDEIDDDDDEVEEEEESDGEEKKKQEKSSLKECLKNAKTAITNKVKFNDGSADNLPSKAPEHSKSNTKQESANSPPNSKNLLIDASIKVDETIGSALKNFLGNQKERTIKAGINPGDGGYVCDRPSQDQMDPELMRKHTSVIRSNPRVKRYFSNIIARRK